MAERKRVTAGNYEKLGHAPLSPRHPLDLQIKLDTTLDYFGPSGPEQAAMAARRLRDFEEMGTTRSGPGGGTPPNLGGQAPGVCYRCGLP